MDDFDVSPLIRSILAASQATRTGRRADAATMRALLIDLGYPAHEAVLAFEKGYGGLELFESEDVPALVVGPFACLADGKYKGKEGQLVPVMFAHQDVIHSLDGEGRGYTRAAMVEGVSRLAARDGRQLVTQAILWRRAHILSFRGSTHVQAAEGASRAADLGLDLLTDASSDVERWWGDAHKLVVEIPRGNGWPGPTTWGVG